jgi:hypothetical protein
MTEPTKQEFYQAYLSGELTPTNTKILNVRWYGGADADETSPTEDNVHISTEKTFSFGSEVWKVKEETLNGELQYMTIER